jgi:hypothetical protein
MIALLALCAAAIFSLAYFSAAARAALPDRFAELRRGHTGQWIARGMLGVTVVGGMWAVVTYFWVSLLAQHFGTTETVIQAEALETTTYTGGRGICRERISVRFADNTDSRFCLRTASSTIASFEPQPGERLVLTVRRGVLGSAVQRVERSESRP